MDVIVTGAGGLVGRACVDEFAKAGDSVQGFLRAECDIADADSVRSAFNGVTPDLIVNCAAYTDVDGAESDREGCFRVNVDGVRHLTEMARSLGCLFVSISTDYVFGGEKQGFYSEEDSVNPKSVYGRSKVTGEEIAGAYEKSVVVRTGWIFGHGGTNFLSVLPELLKDGNSITAISDSYGTPTYATNLAQRIRELAESGGKGVFHVTDSGEGASYHEFASAAAEFLHVPADLIKPVNSSELSRPAPRPANSRLACERAAALGLPDLPHWRDALKAHIV